MLKGRNTYRNFTISLLLVEVFVYQSFDATSWSHFYFLVKCCLVLGILLCRNVGETMRASHFVLLPWKNTLFVWHPLGWSGPCRHEGMEEGNENKSKTSSGCTNFSCKQKKSAIFTVCWLALKIPKKYFTQVNKNFAIFTFVGLVIQKFFIEAREKKQYADWMVEFTEKCRLRRFVRVLSLLVPCLAPGRPFSGQNLSVNLEWVTSLKWLRN